MKRIHRMPFGAELLTEGGTRFRLWAPAAHQVELLLGETAATMDAQEDGWHVLDRSEAHSGDRYRFRIDGGQAVPDPASRYQPDDVHGASEVIDAHAFDWQDKDWRGRPWEEAVIYELHTGAFSPEGNFAGVEARLDYLHDLGISAIELMPVSDFPGRRNWGYDGVLPFAPDASYGCPEALKSLVQAAHGRGLMVFLDVVYNHFGPEGNYLHLYAPQFFTERHHTPWGAAINFDGEASGTVRQFFIHNALYWLEEFHLDGLRFDAVDQIYDDSEPHFLTELAEAVRAGPGRERQIHLVLENDKNEARRLARADGRAVHYTAQWDDDSHHAYHVLLTGEDDGYYQDYAQKQAWYLGRCLAEGFAYQGEASPYRDGKSRGEPSGALPLTAFVDFLQNHDQIGNRAFGRRLSELAPEEAVRAATAILLLAPSPPLLFMGQEFAAAEPFLFFCDFDGELAQAVTEGRRREFARFARFADPEARERIPDPNAPSTFESSKLDWQKRESQRQFSLTFQELLELRRREIVPRLKDMPGDAAQFEVFGNSGLKVVWRLGDGARLTLVTNLSAEPVAWSGPGTGDLGSDKLLYAVKARPDADQLAPWSALWYLNS
jgi:malto-oligosyltrehalose trehalohydrolase